MIRILPLDKTDKEHVRQAADILADNFPHCYGDCAEEEIQSCLAPDRIALAAVEDDRVIGFIGGIEDYDGNVWELHPLAVAKDRQRSGVGTMLLHALEAECASRGGMTMMLSTDDEFGQTSLYGQDLYDDLYGRMQNIRNLKGHPYEFYQKNGYRIVGVIPDANGCGKPDILMAKRIGKR